MQASATMPTTCSCGGRIYRVSDYVGYCGRCDRRYTATHVRHRYATAGTIPMLCACGGAVVCVSDTAGYCDHCGLSYAAAPQDAHVTAWRERAEAEIPVMLSK